MKIYTSKTKLPSLSDYNKYLKKIWKSNWLTNDGKLVQKLEKKLEEYWGVKNVVCVDHGTSAISIALKALNVKELYLSPNSFVATASAPLWLGIKLHFVDFGEHYGSPALVTHAYGVPDLVDARPVIYDASHAFTTKVNGKSILSYGDISIISFHATKIFHSVEGGAIVTNSDALAKKARWMRNFGFKTPTSFYGAGINAKMSEFHAAMGLAMLPLVGKIRKRYDQIIKRYNTAFGYEESGSTFYPIWYETEKDLLRAVKLFNKNNIYPRRYFYPSLNTVFGGKCPASESMAKRVLCLPLYYDLTDRDVDRIIKITKQTL